MTLRDTLSLLYSKVEANGNGRKAAVKKISPLAQERIALSDILSPLQQGIFSKDSSGRRNLKMCQK